jgi:hypothetical protein
MLRTATAGLAYACSNVSKILTYDNVSYNRPVMTYVELMPFMIKVMDDSARCGKPFTQEFGMHLDQKVKIFFMHHGKGPKISEKNGKILLKTLIGSLNRFFGGAKTEAKPAHMKIPCMTLPSTSQAYTVFNTVDKNNSNTISWSELLKA